MTIIERGTTRPTSLGVGPVAGTVTLGGGVGILVRLVDLLLLWQDRAAQRRHLASLDDRLLRDLGLSRASATTEADKPFWIA